MFISILLYSYFSQSSTRCPTVGVWCCVSSLCSFQCGFHWSSDLISLTFLEQLLIAHILSPLTWLSFSLVLVYLLGANAKKKKERYNYCDFKTLIELNLDIIFSCSVIILSGEYLSIVHLLFPSCLFPLPPAPRPHFLLMATPTAHGSFWAREQSCTNSPDLSGSCDKAESLTNLLRHQQ